VLDPALADKLAGMLETVTGPEGTGELARVEGYRVAGKTGTSRKAAAGGYGDRYVASFAGFAPVSDPRLAAVVVVNDPSGEQYYGGQVAAPLFSKVMGAGLRLFDVAPDDPGLLMARVEESPARQEESGE
jgi:cell division protein FtsI (penicillin-binding protein 3)